MTHILLGEWGFLDNLEDTSGHALSASANFSPTFIDGPSVGTRAIRFSGTGQTISFGRSGLEPAATDGGIVTMAWAKMFSAGSGYSAVIHKTRAFDSTRHGLDISGTSAFLVSRWRDQLAFRENGSQFADLGWHHICNVDSEDRYAWFVDGVLIQESLRSGTSPVSWEDFPWVSGYAPAMASMNSNADVAITGIRILSGTLSNEEVVSYMSTPIVPPGRSGKAKVWNGTEWVQHPAKVWNGSSWEPAKLKVYDGTDWIIAK